MTPPTNNGTIAALVVAALVTSGCLGLTSGDASEPEATNWYFDRVPTVSDMSGALPATSVGVYESGPYYDAGKIPSGVDADGTVLIDFQPDLGPTSLGVSLCIDTGSGYRSPGPASCEAYEHSTGDAVQLDATRLSGQTIFLSTAYGAGTGTTYTLCVSVFDFHRPAEGYTAIVDGHCHDPPSGAR